MTNILMHHKISLQIDNHYQNKLIIHQFVDLIDKSPHIICKSVIKVQIDSDIRDNATNYASQKLILLIN